MVAKFPKEGGSSSPKKAANLQELMKKLVLKDEELDDVVLPKEEFVNLREDARWMAVVKVHTSKHFGNQPFFQKMDAAWGFAKKWSIRPVEDNLFVLQVSCLGDWNRAMLDGPWIFRQQGVLLEPYDRIADPNSVKLTCIHAWVQVRGIPPLFHKEAIVRDMAARIGEVLSVDLYALGASGTSFVRVRVKLDVNKPLTSMETGCVPQSMTGIHKHRVCGSELLEGKLAVEAEEGGGEEGDHRILASARVESPNAGEKVNPGQLQVTDGSGKNGEKEDPGERRNLDLALREEDGKKDVGTNASPGKKPDPKRPRKGDSNTDEAVSGEGRR
ncbi:hypothetical protein ACQ4PT_032152 [Festuca glaucescens]